MPRSRTLVRAGIPLVAIGVLVAAIGIDVASSIHTVNDFGDTFAGGYYNPDFSAAMGWAVFGLVLVCAGLAALAAGVMVGSSRRAFQPIARGSRARGPGVSTLFLSIVARLSRGR